MKPAPGKRGRPCGFDRDQALRCALDVFWTVGYEGATMSALKKAMGGLCAPSVYAAYGSKEALFKSALDLYRSEHSEPLWHAFESADVRTGVQALLHGAALLYSTPGKPRGCLVDLSTLNFSPANRAVDDYVRGLREQTRQLVLTRFDRARREGELPESADVQNLAAFITTILQGLSIQARDGADRERLMAIVQGAMVAWDAMLA